MAHNFRKQNTQSYNKPVIYISKSAPNGGDGSTPENAVAHPINAAPIGSGSTTYNGELTYMDGNRTAIIGAGHYQGEITTGFPHRLIADGKVVWYVNGRLWMGTKVDNGEPMITEGVTFRFVDTWRPGYTGGGFAHTSRTIYRRCVFDFMSNADINIIQLGSAGSWESFNINEDSIFKKVHGPNNGFLRCYLFSSKLLNVWQFKNCYLDSNSFLELRDASMLSDGSFLNNNIQGQIRVKNDAYGYTDITTFKQNYGIASRLDIVGRDPRFNKPASDDYTLKIDSPHLDLQIGPSHLRFALMYYVDSSVSAGDPCTVSNTRLKNAADNSLVQFREIGGFTINASGGLVVVPNSLGNFEGYYTTNRVPIAATSQRIKLLPVISGLNFDSDFPASAAAFSSVSPEVFNNNVPDYSNSSTNGGRTPNRLTVQARFSTLANPDENTNEHWVPSNGQFLDFEIDEEPLYDSVTGYGSGHPLFNPTSPNVRPVLARFVQIRYKSRNDYYSK